MQTQSTKLLLREAKRLHRAATSDSLSQALPVLRRFLNAGATPIASLPDLFRQRHGLQRKHVLRLLAMEAGYSSWEAYRPALSQLTANQFEHLAVSETGFAHLNLWFASEVDALAFVSENGGRVVRVGQQAVVMPCEATDSSDRQGVI